MPSVNWNTFEELPGAITENFEKLYRAAVWLHYGKHGNFHALKNQPGVEFHLHLNSDCALGKSGQWFGWQCKWYQLNSNGELYSKQKTDIVDAINKTKNYLPNITDWILCTQYTLSKKDQEWFYGLTINSGMKLDLWSKSEIESLLTGPAVYLRETYFGDLVLTPDILKEQFNISVSSVKQRWIPVVHQVVDAETSLHRMLLEDDAWSQLIEISKQFEMNISMSMSDSSGLENELLDNFEQMMKNVSDLREELDNIYISLCNGDYNFELQVGNLINLKNDMKSFLHKLRKNRHPLSLSITNLLADIRDSIGIFESLSIVLDEQIVAVIADAGYGKTQLSAQLTKPMDNRPAGILLHGCNLHAAQSLDTLANRIKIHGKPIESFDALINAVNAAGERAKKRLPIVIDGLNESEDPRDWKRELASLETKLKNSPYVCVVCTLRKDFIDDAIPENINKIEMNGFEVNTVEAIKEYFRLYKINPIDVTIPFGLLEHPLTLRIFCESINHDRKENVGVEKIPGSLVEVFALYIEQIAERIVSLSSKDHRYYENDIYKSLRIMGLYLWENRCRDIELYTLREILNDNQLPWNKSIVRYLEHEGLLLRSSQKGTEYMSFAYDALAGHIIAKSLLETFDGNAIKTLLNSEETMQLFVGNWEIKHPLATDIFEALVGLFVKYNYNTQLYSILDNIDMKNKAVYRTAWLDKKYLDAETTELLSDLIIKTDKPILFNHLKNTRSALEHPLNSKFLDKILQKLSMNERDFKWSEWIRVNQDRIIIDLQNNEERWRSVKSLDERDYLIARWVMWTLTSTVRLLRDQATKTLYWYGAFDPKGLFDLTIQSLDINDPYVPERMFATSYGVVMSFWSKLDATVLRGILPEFANTIVDQIFLPGASNSTRHTLMRDYALGIVEIAQMVQADCIQDDRLQYLKAPFLHMSSPFKNPEEILETDVVSIKNAISMDFGNYTIGHLIPKRRNYDFKNEDYKKIRNQIEYRIKELGYSSEQFKDIDREIGELSWRAEQHDGVKVDRYGKKYSWIAYFEMYGLRSDEGLLPDWRSNERTSYVDIDPSFPEIPLIWQPILPDIFSKYPNKPREWIADGPTPNYNHLLEVDEIDGVQGPWVLLDGFIEESSIDKERKIFTFLWNRLVKSHLVDDLLGNFSEIEYPGNHAIPEAGSDVYSFAGEIPWSKYFASSLRNSNGEIQRDIDNAFSTYSGSKWKSSIDVEIPVFKFNWESYHSALNKAGGVTIPAPALFEKLGLFYQQGEWDYYDNNAKVATIYREFKSETSDLHLFYIRADLMKYYLQETKQEMVWFVWGEREVGYDIFSTDRDELQPLWSQYKHIHRQSKVWINDL